MSDPVQPERVVYSDGQLLKLADFQAEQAFHIALRELLTRFLYTPGVLNGLEVTAAPGAGGWTISVSAGAALNGAGQLLLLSGLAQFQGGPVQAGADGSISLTLTEPTFYPPGEPSRWRLLIGPGDTPSSPARALPAPVLTLTRQDAADPALVTLADIVVTAMLPPAAPSPPDAPPAPPVAPVITVEVGRSAVRAAHLAPSRLPMIEAAMLSGAISLDQLPLIPAAKIGGMLSADQLPETPAARIEGVLSLDQLPLIPPERLSAPLTEVQVPLLSSILARLDALEAKVPAPPPPPVPFTFDGNTFLVTQQGISPLLQSGFTFQALINLSSLDGELPLMSLAVDGGDPAAAAWVVPGTPATLWLSLLNGAPHFELMTKDGGSGVKSVTGRHTMLPGTWSVVSLSWSPSAGATLYLDGTPTAALQTDISAAGNLLLVATQGRDFLRGQAIWFMIWSGARNEDAIAAVPKRSLTSKELVLLGGSDLEAYWQLDEAEEGIVPNRGPKQNSAKFAPSSAAPKAPTAPPRPQPVPKASALRFNGVDQWLEVPGVPHLDRLTVELRLRAASFHGGNWQDAIASRHGSGAGWELRLGEAIPRMMITAGGAHLYAQPLNPWAAPRLPTGQWLHVAGSYDGETIKVYVDGALAYVQAAGGPITSYGGDMMIGRNANPQWGERYFAGDIAEVRLWDQARSPAAIQNASGGMLAGPEAGLVGWWTMGEGAGDRTADLSGNGHQAIIRGATWIAL